RLQRRIEREDGVAAVLERGLVVVAGGGDRQLVEVEQLGQRALRPLDRGRRSGGRLGVRDDARLERRALDLRGRAAATAEQRGGASDGHGAGQQDVGAPHR